MYTVIRHRATVCFELTVSHWQQIECLTFVFEFILRSIWKLLQALYWTVYYVIRIALDTIAMAFGAVAAVSGVRTCQMMQICSEGEQAETVLHLQAAHGRTCRFRPRWHVLSRCSALHDG